MVSFNAVLPIWTILSTLTLLSLVFIWLEWRRQQPLPIIRIIAVCLMMLALTAIFLRPTYQKEKSLLVILLTNGYDRMKVDSLLETQSNLTLLHTSDAKSYKGSKLLSYFELPDFEGNIQFIVGEGLPLHALDMMNRKTFQFVSSKIPEGVTQLGFNDIFIANRINKLQGVYHNKTGKTQITLKGPAGNEDSILIQTIGEEAFHLSFSPRQTGNVLYELNIQKKEEGKPSIEVLPLHIEESKPLRILFLQSYPSFEIQYLKNFLSAKGHQLQLRYQLSKNNYRYEYTNLPSKSFTRLTTDLLNQFDLVIASEDELTTLSTSEQNTLYEMIQSGLGLLVLNPDPSNKSKQGINFLPFQFQKIKYDTTSITVSGLTRVTLSALPYRALESSLVKPIIKSEEGVLSGYQHRGLGKIGFQFLQQTYQLTLAGDSLSYANLWSLVIEHVARFNTVTSKIKIKKSFPIYEDEPIDIEIISSDESPIFFVDSIQSPLQENVLIDNVWNARTWASKEGWHTLQLKDDVSLQYYVFNQDDWKTPAAAQKIKTNELGITMKEGESVEKIMQSKVVNPIFLYFLFVLTAGFLWLAPKL